ncbi:MAG: ABC transporter ATP-binding protein [Betaproteobacteria bacterium]|nr:ABC transporter ATP-binding protein [Betaproteobacteria bacterium]
MLLRVADVRKRFGGYEAVAGISFEVAAGSIHSLIGPNGAGKTTLLNLISGVLPPTAGRMWFCDVEYTGRRADQILEMGIARNFQHVRLFRTMSVSENVLVGRHARIRGGFLAAILALPFRHTSSERASRVRVDELLEIVGLAHRRETSVDDLTMVEQRRVEIARALASDPILLMLDEPAAGMNPAEVEGLMQLIRLIREQGTTVLLVEHHMRLVMAVSHKVTVLTMGTLLAQGTPEEIRQHPQVISAYLGNEGWAS